MQFKRMFTTDAYKGTRGYLRTQKTYEILRTVLYFAISLSLFIAERAEICGRLAGEEGRLLYQKILDGE